MGTIAIVAGVLLVLIVWGIVEHAAGKAHVLSKTIRSGPGYKTHWQLLGNHVATGLTLGAYFLISPVAGAVTIGAVFLGYAVFRHFLSRSSAMQHRFSHKATPKKKGRLQAVLGVMQPL